MHSSRLLRCSALLVLAVVFVAAAASSGCGTPVDDAHGAPPALEVLKQLQGATEAEVIELLGEPDSRIEWGHTVAPQDWSQEQTRNHYWTEPIYTLDYTALNVHINRYDRVYRVDFPQ